MNLTKTAIVLICVLVILLAASVYLWMEVGIGEPEVDPKVASAIQHLQCGECGHVFEMRLSKVAAMRRSRGEIFCPECGKGGVQKVASLEGKKVPASESSHEEEEPSTSTPKRPGSGKKSHETGETAPEVSNHSHRPAD